MDKFLVFLGIVKTIIGAAGPVWAAVGKAMKDGTISPEEARGIGFSVSDSIGDLRISIRGHDVVGAAAQRELCGALGRIARQVVLALREE